MGYVPCKKILLFATLLLLIGSYSSLLHAQNNPFKIDDELYTYYNKCFQNVKQREVLAMSDTLIAMCKRKHDLKAQCLAMSLKGEYYYYRRDIENLRKEAVRVANFARKTPYQQYVFSIWNRLITYYLTNDQLALAFDEIRKYQKEALRLNNSYGIGTSYRKLADVYIIQHNADQAIIELDKAIDYFKKNGKENELYDVYGSKARAYLANSDFKHAEEFSLKAINNTQPGMPTLKNYLTLATACLRLGEMDKVAEYIQVIQQQEKKGRLGLLDNEAKNKLFADYYINQKQYDKALESAQKISSNSRYLYLSKIYDYKKDYEKAFSNYIIYADAESKRLNEDQKNQLAEYSAKFDNERVEKEKNLLELKNTKLKMQQLRTKDRLLLFEKERNGLKLSNAQLELINKNLELERQAAVIAKQKSDANNLINMAKTEVQKAKTRRVIGYNVIIVLVLILIALSTYAILRNRSNQRLKKEMEEVRKARNEAEVARAEAERANQLKTHFLKNMSHEIRTPLNAIVGFSDMLADENMPLTPDDKVQFGALIHSNTRLLTALIDDILDLSSLESGTYKVLLEDVSAYSLCSQAVATVHDRAPEGVSLQFIRPEQDVTLHTDISRVLQVLNNFLSNACKYTEKGSIILTYELQPEQIVFSVTDTGCGIKPENAVRIFNRFEKLNSMKQGTGLGLNICQSIARLLYGTVKLDASYTGGSRFLFILPR